MDDRDLFLTGSKIRLRAFREADVESLYKYVSHPDLKGRQYLPWSIPRILPLRQDHITKAIEEWNSEDKAVTLAITQVDQDEAIGHIGAGWDWDPLMPTIWMALSPLEQRKGYGTEAIGIVLRFLYENHPANHVSIWVDDWNQAGVEFLKATGFSSSGKMRRSGMRNGRFVDTVVMGILRREWLAKVEEGIYGA